MFYYIAHYLWTPWLTARHAIANAMKFFVPTHIHHVVHMNMDASMTTVIHPKGFWSFNTRAIMNLAQVERDTGYYYICTWDGLQRKSYEYFLSAQNLRTALGVTSLSNWWAFHDYGIQVLLQGYMTYHRNPVDSGALFAIYDDADNDLSQHVHHKLLRSLELKNNITTKALTRLLRYLGHIPHERAVAKIVDFDLEERILAPDDSLFHHP